MSVSLVLPAGSFRRAGLDPVVGPGHALGQRSRNGPAEIALGAFGGQRPAEQLAGAGRSEHRVDGPAGYLADHLDQLQDADLDPAADVPGTWPSAVGSGQERPDGVADIDIVPGLAPVAIDSGTLAGQRLRAEDGHHAGRARRIL